MRLLNRLAVNLLLLLPAVAGWTASYGAEPLTVPPGKPEYPLYSPFFGSSHRFTEADITAVARVFDFVYGQPLSKEEMEAGRRINPQVQFIRYVGAWTMPADLAERSLRRQILYYPAAALGEDLDLAAAEFHLVEIPERKQVSLKPSNIAGPYSKSMTEYVTWIRIGDELMRVETFDAVARRVRVTRNFDGEKAQTHLKGDRVFSPAYGVAPLTPNEWERSKTLTYHHDPTFPARWSRIYDILAEFVAGGGDGVWIDILMDRSLDETDVDGKYMRPPGPGLGPTWNYTTGRLYRRDEFRQKNEAGVRSIQERFREKFGRYPVIYANNMMAEHFEEGQGGGRFYLLSTPQKPRPLDGMCIEDFMGGYDFPEWDLWTKTRTPSIPKKACYPCNAIYKNWAENLKTVMKAAQAGMPAAPLIINAGMKTAIFEAMDRKARHEWELWAYASYLLGVEKKNGVCPTKLGVPMFYREGEKRYVAIDPMYYWRLGEPAETVKAEDLARYRLPGTEAYRRRFTKGVVLVNPSALAQEVRLEDPLTDPESGAKTTSVTLAPQSGKILLNRR